MADEPTNNRAQEDVEAADMLAEAVEGADSPEEPAQQFDADAAKAKINKTNRENAGLRKRLKELEPLAQRLQDLEDANKSELEKANERATGAEGRASSAEARALRLEVALAKAPDGMPISKIRTLAKRLTGSTQEELEADAEELFAEFAPAENSTPAGQRPTEKLSSVPLPNSDKLQVDEETNPRELAKRIRRV